MYKYFDMDDTVAAAFDLAERMENKKFKTIANLFKLFYI